MPQVPRSNISAEAAVPAGPFQLVEEASVVEGIGQRIFITLPPEGIDNDIAAAAAFAYAEVIPDVTYRQVVNAVKGSIEIHAGGKRLRMWAPSPVSRERSQSIADTMKRTVATLGLSRERIEAAMKIDATETTDF